MYKSKVTQWGKGVFSTNIIAGTTGEILGKKFNFYLIPHIKINFKWTEDLTLKAIKLKTI